MTSVNGKPYTAAPGMTIADLVQEIVGRHAGVAVAVDGAVVPRSAWGTTKVSGDIDIVTAAQGG
ncbi:sulfur carrier protein ThiS [Corynebacterium hindlerae]|uniref:sulfur carrier protein ThiS n=1 Tax=Corynebacterium hindlerae TaxID=699041 RepID=UPI003B8488A6